MAYENIKFSEKTFCVGPQTGSFCMVNTSDINNVVLQVKNNSGDLIRNYSFLPHDIFYTDKSIYPHKEITCLKYVGPRDLAYFYTGAVFYTLEGIVVGKYSIQDREDDIEYSDGCIIRKWSLDSVLFTLTLINTFHINSTIDGYIDPKTFSVQYTETTFLESTTTQTEIISITNTNDIHAKDILLLGPSTDVDNTGQVELVYVHSVDGNTVHIRSFDGTTPTRYEYVVGDYITVLRDIFLFSNPKPIIYNNFLSYFEGQGTVYRLSQSDYGNVIDKDENARYKDIVASNWNNYTGGLSFLKSSTYTTVDVNSNYDNLKTRIVKVIALTLEELPVYAVDSYGTDLYFLQKKVIKVDDQGQEQVVFWTTYNYVKDSIIPYGYSINLITQKDVLTMFSQIEVKITVRDQFNIGVLGANVLFTFTNDFEGILDPSSGNLTTDVDGNCYLTFTTGSSYTGTIKFNARSDKGNVTHGSSYINCTKSLVKLSHNSFTATSILQSVPTFKSTHFITQLLEKASDLTITCLGRYMFGLGSVDVPDKFKPPIHEMECAIVSQIKTPTRFTTMGKLQPLVTINIMQLDITREMSISQIASVKDDIALSQMKSSRHLLDLNKDNVAIDQYVFIADAIPPFWSEKIPVNTYIWVRMRPFAYSLDPDSLIFEVKEVNLTKNIDTGFIDVSSLGTKTLYDAGSGMYGVDFLYQPGNFYTNESTIYVNISILDFAPTPNYIKFNYWFKIIDDYKGPVVYNVHPPKESKEVPLGTLIYFSIIDKGIGLDIKDVEVFVNDTSASYTYIELAEFNYKITIDNTVKFSYGTTITVNVVASDSSKFKNTVFDFWTLTFEKSTGPYIDMENARPSRCSRGVGVLVDELTFQIYAIDYTYIDFESIKVLVDSKNFEDKMDFFPIVAHKN